MDIQGMEVVRRDFKSRREFSHDCSILTLKQRWNNAALFQSAELFVFCDLCSCCGFIVVFLFIYKFSLMWLDTSWHCYAYKLTPHLTCVFISLCNELCMFEHRHGVTELHTTHSSFRHVWVCCVCTDASVWDLGEKLWILCFGFQWPFYKCIAKAKWVELAPTLLFVFVFLLEQSGLKVLTKFCLVLLIDVIA